MAGRIWIPPYKPLDVSTQAVPGGGYVMCFSDITAEAKARDELEAARAELEERVAQRTAELTAANASLARTTRDKSRFLAAASHDLVQPLHAARLFLSALDRTLVDHSLTGKINQSIAAAEQILRSLLDISRLEAAGIEPVAVPFSLRPMLRDVLDRFVPEATAKGLTLRLGAVEAVVEGDETMGRSIVQNLIANAVRYPQAGGVLVGVRRRGATTSIEAWDSGPGIPADDRKRIFAEFERLERGDDAGIGLGLAIVERTARLLGAPVSLRSEVGKGSRFSIALPLTDRPVRYVPTVASSPTGEQGASVLVVDDDPRVCEAMEAMLRARGHRPFVSRSAAAALEAVGPYDAALIDYQLGGDIDGLDLIAKLPVAACALGTAQRDPSVLRRADGAGVALLAKPLDPAALDDWFAAVLGKGRSRS